MNSNVFDDVREFHEAFGLRIGDRPFLPSQEERELRGKLLLEEFMEYIDAENDSDIVEIADALSDIIYVAVGTAIAYGIPLDKVHRLVHKSNMAKLVNGKPIKRADGKIMKPVGWKPPDIDALLKRKTQVKAGSWYDYYIKHKKGLPGGENYVPPIKKNYHNKVKKDKKDNAISSST